MDDRRFRCCEEIRLPPMDRSLSTARPEAKESNESGDLRQPLIIFQRVPKFRIFMALSLPCTREIRVRKLNHCDPPDVILNLIFTLGLYFQFAKLA